MYSRAKLLEKVKEFFVEKEMEVERAPDTDSLDYLVRDGRNIIGVKLVAESKLGMSFRDTIEEILLKSTELQVDKFYVAVPARFIPLLPKLEIFKTAKAGVLEIREEGVYERIVPQARSTSKSISGVSEIAERIDKIERVLGDLERKIAILFEEVDSLKSIKREIEEIRKEGRIKEHLKREGKALVHQVQEEADQILEGVPSFVVGNPWLKVLSRKRGENDLGE